MTATPTADTVDVNVPRFNQAMVATTTAAAFVAQWEWLVVAVLVVLALTRLGGPRLGLFTQIWVRLIRPRVDPGGPRELEPAAPPRFAQSLGVAFLAAASVAFWAGASVIGWALTLVVCALAALAAATRICVGCLLYERTVAR